MYNIKTVKDEKEIKKVFNFLSSLFYDDAIEHNEHYYTMSERLEEMKKMFEVDKDFLMYIEDNKKIINSNKNINEEFNTNLRDIIEKYYPDSTLITLTLLVNNKGLYIPSNVKKAYEEMTPIIGSAIFDDNNKLGISIYYRDKQVLETFYLDKTKLENIQRFNSFSAYCSARGVFYISGGEGEEQSVGGNKVGDQEAYGNFIGIDMTKLESYLNNEEISKNEEDTPVKKLPSLNIERSWHSMIFIPNKYIFIIGGIYTQIVERYDIDKNEIKLDS